METKLGIVCSTLVLLAITGAALKGCSEASQRYHERAKLCIQAGGSWMQGRGDGDGVCFNGVSSNAQS